MLCVYDCVFGLGWVALCSDVLVGDVGVALLCVVLIGGVMCACACVCLCVCVDVCWLCVCVNA